MRRMIPTNQIDLIKNLSKGLLPAMVYTEGVHLTHPTNSSISSSYNIDLLAAINDEEGDYSVEVQLTDNGIIVNPDFNATGECYLTILNLPTSDPGVEGALWNDNGTLKISAGK